MVPAKKHNVKFMIIVLGVEKAPYIKLNPG